MRVLLLLVAASLTLCDAEPCWCGWFVQSMIPGLSTLPPLEMLDGGQVDDVCEYLGCMDICAAQGEAAGGLDLDEIVDGEVRGQMCCDRVSELTTGEVDNDPLFVLGRVPDCDDYFIWGRNRAFISETSFLCCVGGIYSPGQC